MIRVDEASIASVLQALHDKYRIEISAAEDALPTEPRSISLNGDLHAILQVDADVARSETCTQ